MNLHQIKPLRWFTDDFNGTRRWFASTPMWGYWIEPAGDGYRWFRQSGLEYIGRPEEVETFEDAQGAADKHYRETMKACLSPAGEPSWREISEWVIQRLAYLSISDRECVKQLMVALDEDATEEGIEACVVTLAEILENERMQLSRWPLPPKEVDADGFVVGEDAE